MTDPVSLEEVRRARVTGERGRIAFDPEIHPGIAYRLYAMGRGHEDVASAIGIGTATLNGWLELYPEMVKARAKAQQRDTEIMQSIEDHAIGYKDEETGRYVGGNASLLRFLGATRLGMVPPKGDASAEERFDGMSADQLRREAAVLARKLKGVVEEPGGSSAGA